MTKAKFISSNILVREQFESKRCYLIAHEFVTAINRLIQMQNNGWQLIQDGRFVTFDPRVKFYEIGDVDVEEGDNKTGELHMVLDGGIMLFGHIRSIKGGKIYVGRAELNHFVKSFRALHVNNIINLKELINDKT